MAFIFHGVVGHTLRYLELYDNLYFVFIHLKTNWSSTNVMISFIQA